MPFALVEEKLRHGSLRKLSGRPGPVSLTLISIVSEQVSGLSALAEFRAAIIYAFLLSLIGAAPAAWKPYILGFLVALPASASSW